MFGKTVPCWANTEQCDCSGWESRQEEADGRVLRLLWSRARSPVLPSLGHCRARQAPCEQVGGGVPGLPDSPALHVQLHWSLPFETSAS